MTLNKLGKGFIIQKKDGSGWVKFYENKGRFFIVDLEVKSDMRRKGIGSLLVKEVIERAETKGGNVYLIALTTSPAIDNKALIDFYERLGFVEQKEDHTGRKGIRMIRRNKGR